MVEGFTKRGGVNNNSVVYMLGNPLITSPKLANFSSGRSLELQNEGKNIDPPDTPSGLFLIYVEGG